VPEGWWDDINGIEDKTAAHLADCQEKTTLWMLLSTVGIKLLPMKSGDQLPRARRNVPFFKHPSNWLEKNVADNGEVGPHLHNAERRRLYAQRGVDSNLNGDTAPDRTIIDSGVVAGIKSAVTPFKDSTNRVVACLATNPSAHRIQAGLGAYAIRTATSVAIFSANTFRLVIDRHNAATRFTIQTDNALK
jgi:hypothetical protein